MTVVEARVAGRYRLGPSLGVGGMGRVWLAWDEVLGRNVAVKQVALPFGLSDSEREELRMRTLREARAAARLNHTNVVKIFDVVHGDDQPYIVMEYVRSRSLLQVIEENGPLAVDQVAGIGLAVLSALDAANHAGVLHRDVKPSNVLIADDGRVVLTDFGSAMIDESEGAITRTGVILGSPQYIAPERAYNGVSTAESDLWSLGATLYAAAEGRAPYTRPTAMATLIALATKRPDPMRRAGPLKPVLTGLLQRDPRARMTAAEAERLLHKVADVQTAVRLRIPPPRRTAAPSPEKKALESSSGTAVTAAHRASLEAAIAQLERGERADQTVPAGRGSAATPVTSAVAAAAVPGSVATSSGPTSSGPILAFLNGPARRWRRAAVASAAALVVILGTAAALRFDDVRRSAAGPLVAGTDAARTDVARTPINPPAAPSSDVRGDPDAPPPGHTWWHDESGFQVAFPVGWENRREGQAAMLFCEPGGRKVLRVRAWDGNERNPFAVLAHEASRAKMSGYRPIRMESMPQGSRAEWEYTFDGATTRVHGLERASVVGGRVYIFQWHAPQEIWQSNLAAFDVMVSSFRPPRRSHPTPV